MESVMKHLWTNFSEFDAVGFLPWRENSTLIVLGLVPKLDQEFGLVVYGDDEKVPRPLGLELYLNSKVDAILGVLIGWGFSAKGFKPQDLNLRRLAVECGVGFLGRNMQLINHKCGPALWLGAIETDLHLDPTPPLGDRFPSCIGCMQCITACPEQVLEPFKFIEKTRCRAYLPSPKEVGAESVVLCSVCVDVCPIKPRLINSG